MASGYPNSERPFYHVQLHDDDGDACRHSQPVSIVLIIVRVFLIHSEIRTAPQVCSLDFYCSHFSQLIAMRWQLFGTLINWTLYGVLSVQTCMEKIIMLWSDITEMKKISIIWIFQMTISGIRL